MLVSEEHIHGLIPQRQPMMMIDCLVSCDEKQAVSQFRVREDNIFVARKRFTSPGMMENMAQTAAARAGYLLTNRQPDVNNKIPVGVIGSIKNYRMNFEPGIGSLLVTTVSIEHEVMQATVVKGKVETGGRVAAECDMQIYITEDQPEKP